MQSWAEFPRNLAGVGTREGEGTGERAREDLGDHWGCEQWRGWGEGG